jgi:hypothetical protein
MQNQNEVLIRFLSAVIDYGTNANRHRVALKVWSKCRYVAKLNALLNLPEMRDALRIAKFERFDKRGKRKRIGRPPVRYALTHVGKRLLKRLLCERDAARIAAEQARVIAAQQRRDILKEISLARFAEAAARHKRAGRRAGPRTPAQIAQFEEARANLASYRAREAAAKMEPDVLTEHEHIEAPRAPIDRPRTPPAPTPRPIQRPLPIGFNAPPPQPWGPATARPAAPPIGTASILEKIKARGYRVNNRGEVLYDNRWIPASEWRAKMAHIEL